MADTIRALGGPSHSERALRPTLRAQCLRRAV
jgi:hypothetical protein